MRRLRIDPFAAVAVVYLLLVERSVWALLALGAAGVHELGHLAAARLLHVPTCGMRIGAFGARIVLDGMIGYRSEAAIAFAGPAVNLGCTAAACLIHRGKPDDRLLFFAAASLALATVNLLPLPTFDGGRIFFCLLADRFGPNVADRCARLLGAAGTILLWIFAAMLWLRTGENLSLLVLACLLLWRGVRGNLAG